MPNSNIESLKYVAAKLGPLVSDVVFVGGCTTGLFITDKAAAEVRATFDVDVIAEIASYPEYATFSERLRAQGFREDTSEGAPLCRWLINKMVVDVMPTEEKILGFTNRWYRAAMDSSQPVDLGGGLRIRTVTAPYFIATKLEAFRGRGHGDFAASHDLEDILTVIDGREEIIQEISAAAEVRPYIITNFIGLLESPAFIDSLPGHLLPDPASQARAPFLLNRIKEIANQK
jgi:hypothetical protein